MQTSNLTSPEEKKHSYPTDQGSSLKQAYMSYPEGIVTISSYPGSAELVDKSLSLNEIRSRCAELVVSWRDAVGDEKQQDQTFIRDLLHAFGIHDSKAALYQKRVQRSSTGNQGYIDALIPGLLLIEMKSSGRPLGLAEAQAMDYIQHLPESEVPRYILTSDFKKFRLLDLHAQAGADVTEFELEELPSRAESLAFLAGYQTRSFGSTEQEEASIKAARLMAKLYEALEGSGYSEHEASIFLVRTLFALFADDAGIWQRELFTEFINTRTAADGSDLGAQLTTLFQVLGQSQDKRFTKLDDMLLRFPYVNGGIFSEPLSIPAFDRNMREQLLKACAFDWSDISPAIFGSLFQAVKDSAARRKLGEHYTTETNIRKVIDPLFLDAFKEEFVKASSDVNALKKLRSKLGETRFLDPACGCGNFLVVAYREMRQLELDVLLRLQALGDKEAIPSLFFTRDDLAVQLDNFAGIEIEEWPARIAETALRLAEHQANQIMQLAIGKAPESLPLDSLDNIKVANALRTDWAELLPEGDSYQSVILGNPPFLGHISREKEQTEELMAVWGRKDIGRLDYVTAWYKKASDLLQSRKSAKFAFVSTNSIAQGEPVPALFKPLFGAGWRISFAHQTFGWSSEAPGEAHVHCVIIGFDRLTSPRPKLYSYSTSKAEPVEVQVSNINAYLVEAQNVLVHQTREIFSPDLPAVTMGSMPRDGGHLLIDDPDEYKKAMSDPIAAKYIRKFVMGNEFINNIPRWCFWLEDLDPQDVAKSQELKTRLQAVAKSREESPASSTKQMALTPHLFGQRSQPKTNYLAFPSVFSNTRRWATVALLPAEVIAGNKIYKCEDKDGFAFAIASSSMFITWQKTIGGRLKSDPNFSNTLVWNSFPLPKVNEDLRGQIIKAGELVIEVREKHSELSLADLYNPLAMKPELLKAHETLDKAVDKAFGVSSAVATNAERIQILFASYQSLAAKS